MSNTELFMWRPELIDHLYEESEINLQQACVNPIQDEVKNVYKNIASYIKVFNEVWMKGEDPYWGPYAFLNYEDKKNVQGDASVYFSESELKFLRNMRQNSNQFSINCLDDSNFYDTFVFDSIDRAFITQDKKNRVVLDIGLYTDFPRYIDDIDISNLEAFRVPQYINAVDINNPNFGFYACYNNLDLLNFFENLCPNGDFVKYDDDMDAYIKAKKRAAKKFIYDEILSKFERDIGPINTLNFMLVHHCHSLGMLLTAKDTSWKIYQNFHVIGYDDKKCLAYGFDTFDE